MRISNHELSPFPALHSVKQPRLTFTAVELKALQRAADILDTADKKATQHYMTGNSELWGSEGRITNPSLSDLNMDLALMLCTGYLQDILANPEGLRLD